MRRLMFIRRIVKNKLATTSIIMATIIAR